MENYPVLFTPVPGAMLICPAASSSKNKLHGQSELIAFARFFKYGCADIREDICVKIDGHNYEPDFAYINKERGVYIDIEVDEPYAASGHPTHFMLDDGTNKDSARNERFRQAGWYIIRFSEEQIFCHTRECLREIYKLAINAGAIDTLPVSLQDTPDLQPQPRWTKSDSFNMKKKLYRMSYLGYNPSKINLQYYLRSIKLILPIMWQSVWSSKVRKMMCNQLWNYFIKR